MTVREFAKLAGFREYDQVTFIECRAIKSKTSPGYDKAYFECPIDTWRFWQRFPFVDYSIVLNPTQSPIDWLSGAPWVPGFISGRLRSLLVIRRADLRLLYPGPQSFDLEKYIDEELRRSFKGVKGGA